MLVYRGAQRRRRRRRQSKWRWGPRRQRSERGRRRWRLGQRRCRRRWRLGDERGRGRRRRRNRLGRSEWVWLAEPACARRRRRGRRLRHPQERPHCACHQQWRDLWGRRLNSSAHSILLAAPHLSLSAIALSDPAWQLRAKQSKTRTSKFGGFSRKCLRGFGWGGLSQIRTYPRIKHDDGRVIALTICTLSPLPDGHRRFVRTWTTMLKGSSWV